MHLFRIAAKQLRYGMEIFAGALGDNLRRESYTRVEHLQQHLGEVNDHVTFRAQCQSWLDQSTDAEERELLERLLERETAAWQLSLESFHRFWTPQCSADLKAQLLDESGATAELPTADAGATADPLTQAASLGAADHRLPPRSPLAAAQQGSSHALALQEPAAALIPAKTCEAAPGEIGEQAHPLPFGQL